MPLRHRMLLGYGSTLVLLLAVLAWAVSNLVRLGRASEAIVTENYRSILAAESMVDHLERQDSASLLVLVGRTSDGREQFRTNGVAFAGWLARAQDNITVEGEGEALSAIAADYDAYTQLFDALQSSCAADSAGALRLYTARMAPVFEEVRSGCLHLRAINERAMFEASDRAEVIALRATVSTLAVGLGAVLLGAIFSQWLTQSLARPVERLTDATRMLADGHYDVRVPSQGRDELANLGAEFNRMASQLQQYHDLNVDRILAEKRRSEAVLQSIEDAVVLIDDDFRVVTANHAAERVLGMPAASAEGRELSDMLRSERLYDHVCRVSAGEDDDRPDEDRALLLRREGSEYHFVYCATLVRSVRSGKRLGVVLLFRDVTRIRELDRLKSEFVAAASHELRTPLTGLSMSLGLLLERVDGPFGERERGLLEAAHEETQRMAALVHDLLDLSRLEAGQVRMELQSVAPSLLLAKAVEALEAQAQARGIALHVDVTADLRCVAADPNKVTWVLSNLLSNALRYTNDGGDVFLAAAAEGEQVRFSVRDEGPGIAPSDQSRIFEKFVQLGSDRDAGGSGLGLAVCREIVRAHRGTIWVESSPGQGSTFVFALPMAKPTRGEREQ